MRFERLEIEGAFLIEPERRSDARGYFARVFCAEEFAAHGIPAAIHQVNVGFSVSRGTLRGLHYQRAPHGECKAVRCTRGSVFDVVVDVRPDSDTCGRWYGAELTPGNGRTLVVPEGCAHGYLTLEDDSEILYSTTCAYVPDAATGYRWDDPAFGIEWPSEPVVISDQDRAWPGFDPNPKES